MVVAVDSCSIVPQPCVTVSCVRVCVCVCMYFSVLGPSERVALSHSGMLPHSAHAMGKEVNLALQSLEAPLCDDLLCEYDDGAAFVHDGARVCGNTPAQNTSDASNTHVRSDRTVIHWCLCMMAWNVSDVAFHRVCKCSVSATTSCQSALTQQSNRQHASV